VSRLGGAVQIDALTIAFCDCRPRSRLLRNGRRKNGTPCSDGDSTNPLSMLVRFLLPVIGAVLLSSCGNNLPVVSKDRALNGKALAGASAFKSLGEFNNDSPSPSIVSAGGSKPKDKHGMPLYGSERVRHVRTTAYTCSEADHIEYGSKNAVGTSLKYTNRVRSAAADWSVYPVGTVFKIKGLPYLYVVDDYGSALTGTGTIDLYKPTKGHMNAWGLRNVEIAIVNWGCYARSAELLSGRTKFAHCREMYVNIQRKTGGQTTASR